MLKYLKWLGWVLYYIPQPRLKDLGTYITRMLRMRPPWWKFKPCMWHNDDGKQWEIYFEEEQSFTQQENLRIDVHRGFETNRIVGLTIWDEKLKCSNEF